MTSIAPAAPARARDTKLVYLTSVLVGVGYGLLFRLFTFPAPRAAAFLDGTSAATMTFSFLGLGSLIIGLLAVYPLERAAAQPVWRWFVLPFPPVLLACVVSLIFKIEGLICMIFALPGAYLCSMVGGVLGGAMARHLRVKKATLVCFAALPFFLAPLETLINPPVQTRQVDTKILIAAPASVVWRNIERVRPIAPAEIQDTWAQTIGFPRPVEATLSYEGIGGVRHASFERGLTFIETINAWQPEHRLAFAIRADTEHIPSTTLDEHVTIGGRYFDVLDGEYRLEPAPGGETMLYLQSRERLSTDFNAYAGLWTDAVMKTLQNSILQVIRARCERETQAQLR